MSTGIEVCLLSFNSAEHLDGAIAALVAQLPPSALAIREHGERPLPEAVAARATAAGWSVRLEHDPDNPGFAAGCNALANGSNAEWLLFHNPDLRIVAWPFGSAPAAVATIIGPGRYVASRAESHRGVRYRTIDELQRSWFRRYGPPPRGQGFVSGAALLVRRTDFLAVGAFDERFFLYYEDIEFCLRANDNGIATRVDDAWAVEHSGAHSTSSIFDRSLQWSYESAVHFKDVRGERLFPYRVYVVTDALLRGCVHAARGHSVQRRGYVQLARRAASDLIGRGRTRRA